MLYLSFFFSLLLFISPFCILFLQWQVGMVKEEPYTTFLTTRKKMPCYNRGPLSIHAGKNPADRKDKIFLALQSLQKEDSTVQHDSNQWGPSQTKIKIQENVLDICSPSMGINAHKQAQTCTHSVHIINAPSRNNLHPGEQEEISVFQWTQLLD